MPDSNLESFLASIVESSDDAIVSKTLDGIVTSWNRAAERIFGYTAAEMIGRPISVLAVPERYEDMRRILETIRRGERIDHYETVRRRKDGRIIHIELTVSPIRDVQGNLVGASKIARDITARKQIEQERAALLEEVRKAVEQRDEFLAMLAHELRNPLAPLRNSIHLLRLKGDDPSIVARVRDMMDRQVTHLGRLVNDLLDVSRITRGMISLDRQRADLARLVAQATEDHRGVFEAAGVALQVDLPETPVWVNIDPTRLMQVLENLFENAGKFTEEGGKIGVEVVADRDSHRAFMRVRDTGIGVDPEMLPRLFDVFTQADRSLDRRRGGLGLGLALVKRLVQLHGGEVEASSPGLGQGTEFTVTLPLEDEPTALTDQSPRDPGPRKQVKVLVVEDNRDSAESLRLLLTSEGYDVTLAFSGTEGIALAHRARPDVVVCDIGLPGMDGYAVARALRNDPGTRKARLIAVTGYSQEGDRSRALESGFDTHVVKPADPQRLLSLID
jgi:PAS domain S-box-containing protein